MPERQRKRRHKQRYAALHVCGMRAFDVAQQRERAPVQQAVFARLPPALAFRLLSLMSLISSPFRHSL